MLLRSLHLRNFRNYLNRSVSFNPFLTIFVGPNARGKTNLLEAIYFIINGTGFRESREEELLAFKHAESAVEAVFVAAEEATDYKVTLNKKEMATEKHYFINKTRKKHFFYLKEQTKAILFSPEQIKIITDSPDIRRDYLNKLISFNDLEYKKRLVNLENAIKRRNKIYELVHEESKLKEELVFFLKV